VGTVVLTSGLRAGRELRLTRIDLPFLLGTALFSDRTRAKAAHTLVSDLPEERRLPQSGDTRFRTVLGCEHEQFDFDVGADVVVGHECQHFAA
jgi:hypothetical protein